MALYSNLASLSQVAASNAADGTVDAPATIDNQTNLLASFIARVRDGDINTPFGTVASATTTVLDGSAASVNISGTTAITGITLAEGSQKLCRFASALFLANGANLVLPGGASITTATGDYAMFVGRSGGVVECIGYQTANGMGVGSWVSNSPSVTASSGAFTTVSGALRYKTIGKTVQFNLIVTITTNGTAAGGVQVTMPFSAFTESSFGGRETQVSGLACVGTMTASSALLTIFRYDNNYAGGTGYRISMNGVVETT